VVVLETGTEILCDIFWQVLFEIQLHQKHELFKCTDSFEACCYITE